MHTCYNFVQKKLWELSAACSCYFSRLFREITMRRRTVAPRSLAPLPNDYVMSECFQIQFIQSVSLVCQRGGSGVGLPTWVRLHMLAESETPHIMRVAYRIWNYWLAKGECHTPDDFFLILNVGLEQMLRYWLNSYKKYYVQPLMNLM